jgi:uncharacterized membrane protein YdjX (TVP38/TMEM64 family)
VGHLPRSHNHHSHDRFRAGKAPGYSHRMRSRRLVGLIGIAGLAFAAAAIFLPHSPTELRALVLGAGLAAPAIALAAWILLTPALFSGTLLAAASGLAFGAAGGAGLAVGGAVLGGLAAFGLARWIGRAPVEERVLRSARLAKLHALLERRPFLALLAARLMPGVPASWLHYVAGVSPVRVYSFTAAIAIGALLRTAPYALLGQGLASGSRVTILLAVGSIALGALCAAALVRFLRTPATAA